MQVQEVLVILVGENLLNSCLSHILFCPLKFILIATAYHLLAQMVAHTILE